MQAEYQVAQAIERCSRPVLKTSSVWVEKVRGAVLPKDALSPYEQVADAAYVLLKVNRLPDEQAMLLLGLADRVSRVSAIPVITGWLADVRGIKGPVVADCVAAYFGEQRSPCNGYGLSARKLGEVHGVAKSTVIDMRRKVYGDLDRLLLMAEWGMGQ
jgi:hypothetical protein